MRKSFLCIGSIVWFCIIFSSTLRNKMNKVNKYKQGSRTVVGLFTSFYFVFAYSSFADPLYKDPSQPLDKRVEDLLSKMTLEEKTAQLQGIWMFRRELESNTGDFVPTKSKEILGNGIGHVSRPSENKSLMSPGKEPEKAVKFINAIQRYLVEETRLGIPAIGHAEGLHGHAAPGATSFPIGIAVASTWEPELAGKMYEVVAREIRARGAHQVLSPILDIVWDPRWGRTEETWGEDPYLATQFGIESIKGLQGDSTPRHVPDDKVLATLKHLAGHGFPLGGRNTAPAMMGERTLREAFLAPFEAVVTQVYPASVMASFNEIDGVPSHANTFLIQDILRKEWGFQGTVVSDYNGIRGLNRQHQIAPDDKAAALLAFKTGIEVDLPDGVSYRGHLLELVKEGKIAESEVDTMVRRVLKDKFRLGLFENPYVDADVAQEIISHEEHRKLALEIAQKSIVLLQNKNNLLPLDAKKINRLAVIGPHVHEVLQGGYSDIPEYTVPIADGFKNKLKGKARVLSHNGITLTENLGWTSQARKSKTFSKERWFNLQVKMADPQKNNHSIQQAVDMARSSDAIVLVLGENEALSRESFIATHLGDRPDIQLPGDQLKLLDAIHKLNKPLIVVMNHGRPLAIQDVMEKADAVVEAWYLGQETGHAVADVVLGHVNPGGKLPITFPRSAGHIPIHYYTKPSSSRGYALNDVTPLFPFGFGLSYTSFAYDALKIEDKEATADGSVSISITVKNVGKREGDEVVQLYIRDKYASITRPVKKLVGFKRIHLKAGQKAKVTFKVHVNQLGFYDAAMKYVVEPGDMEVFVGSSSEDIHAQGHFTIKGNKEDVSLRKSYQTGVKVKYL